LPQGGGTKPAPSTPPRAGEQNPFKVIVLWQKVSRFACPLDSPFFAGPLSASWATKKKGKGGLAKVFSSGGTAKKHSLRSIPRGTTRENTRGGANIGGRWGAGGPCCITEKKRFNRRDPKRGTRGFTGALSIDGPHPAIWSFLWAGDGALIGGGSGVWGTSGRPKVQGATPPNTGTGAIISDLALLRRGGQPRSSPTPPRLSAGGGALFPGRPGTPNLSGSGIFHSGFNNDLVGGRAQASKCKQGQDPNPNLESGPLFRGRGFKGGPAKTFGRGETCSPWGDHAKINNPLAKNGPVTLSFHGQKHE